MLRQLEKPGDPISAAELALVELQLGVRLPQGYRLLMLQYNGGVPVPAYVHTQGMPENPFVHIGRLFSIGAQHQSDDVVWNYDNRPEQLPDGFLPIGRSPSGDLFVLATGGPHAGTVWIWDYYGTYTSQSFERRDLFLLARTWEDFLRDIHDWSHDE